MKKVLLTLLIAVTTLVGCTPEPDNNENKPDKFYGVFIDTAMFTNRGDFYNQNNGTDNLLFRFSTTKDVDGESVAASYLTIEADITLDENGRIPEGTYSVANGDIYPGDAQNLIDGSFFIDFTQNNIIDAYLFINGGEIRVEHLNETEYRFEIEVKGQNIEGGIGAPYEGIYEGAPEMIGLGATNESFVRADDFVMTEVTFVGSDEEETIALWYVSTYDEGYYELVTTGTTELLPAKQLSYYLVTDYVDKETLPKGSYNIDIHSTFTNNTIIEASYKTIKEFRLDEENNKVMVKYDVDDILVDGYLKINPRGVQQNYPMYDLEMVGFGLYDGYKLYYQNKPIAFYDGTASDIELVPIHYSEFSMVEGLYWGPQPANESGTVMTKPYWQMQFRVSTEEFGEQLIAMELFTKDGNTFEEGIPSGTYTVEPMSENLDITKSNFIFPGYYTTNDNGSLSGIYGTYIAGDFETDEQSGQTYFTMLYDCIQGGTMTVENKGDGNYKLEMDFTGKGNMSFSEITGLYEGKIETFDGNALTEEGGNNAMVKAAKKEQKHKVNAAHKGRYIIEGEDNNNFLKPAKSNLFERNFR